MPEEFSTAKGEVSLHIFRLIFFTFVGLDRISMIPFTGCLRLGVVSVPKTAIAPLRPELKPRTQLTPHFQIPRTKLRKMGAFLVNLEDPDVENHDFSSVLAVACFSAMPSTSLPV